MYTLILTIALFNSEAGGSSVEIQAIEGFETVNKCNVAGSRWEISLAGIRSEVKVSHICVRKEDIKLNI